MTKSPILLISPTEDENFVEVLSELRYKIKSWGSRAEVPSQRKTKSGRVFVELDPRRTA